ncbi:exosome complex component RRP46 isoform X1 [Corvus kubaryi]|uniref:exosome complex component RRP46 isoform X1 n=1 Tax=Corvus kubaryi TaxID=68294 RepID=UPI001C05D8BA|nr:exosome complex component RRP46 isoform X1 [Corvus kubaryi]
MCPRCVPGCVPAVPPLFPGCVPGCVPAVSRAVSRDVSPLFPGCVPAVSPPSPPAARARPVSRGARAVATAGADWLRCAPEAEAAGGAAAMAAVALEAAAGGQCRLRPFSCELGLLSRPDGSAAFLQGVWGSAPRGLLPIPSHPTPSCRVTPRCWPGSTAPRRPRSARSCRTGRRWRCCCAPRWGCQVGTHCPVPVPKQVLFPRAPQSRYLVYLLFFSYILLGGKFTNAAQPNPFTIYTL